MKALSVRNLMAMSILSQGNVTDGFVEALPSPSPCESSPSEDEQVLHLGALPLSSLSPSAAVKIRNIQKNLIKTPVSSVAKHGIIFINITTILDYLCQYVFKGIPSKTPPSDVQRLSLPGPDLTQKICLPTASFFVFLPLGFLLSAGGL